MKSTPTQLLTYLAQVRQIPSNQRGILHSKSELHLPFHAPTTRLISPIKMRLVLGISNRAIVTIGIARAADLVEQRVSMPVWFMDVWNLRPHTRSIFSQLPVVERR